MLAPFGRPQTARYQHLCLLGTIWNIPLDLLASTELLIPATAILDLTPTPTYSQPLFTYNQVYPGYPISQANGLPNIKGQHRV